MNEEEKKEGEFTIVKDDGTAVKCYPLITFENDSKHYIIYTDNSTDEEGNTNVYAGIYDPDKGDQRFEPVESPAEVELVNKILASLNEKQDGEQQ